MAYHDKEQTHATTFKHSRQHEVRMLKLIKELDVENKSDVCRVLIDEAYERLILNK